MQRAISEPAKRTCSGQFFVRLGFQTPVTKRLPHRLFTWKQLGVDTNQALWINGEERRCYLRQPVQTKGEVFIDCESEYQELCYQENS